MSLNERNEVWVVWCENLIRGVYTSKELADASLGDDHLDWAVTKVVLDGES